MPEYLEVSAVALDAHDGAHERGLPAARGPQQPGDGARLQVQVQTVEDLLPATTDPQVRGRHDRPLLPAAVPRSSGTVRLIRTPRIPRRILFSVFHHVMNIGSAPPRVQRVFRAARITATSPGEQGTAIRRRRVKRHRQPDSR